MDQISNLLKNRAVLLNKILDRSAKYVKSIRELIIKNDPELHAKITNAVDALRASTDLHTDMSLMQTLNLYDTLNTIEENIKILYQIVINKNYEKQLLYDKSSTYSDEHYQDKRVFERTYDELLTTSVKDDEFIINTVIEHLDVKNHKDELFQFVTTDTKSNKFMFKLVSTLIKETSGTQKRTLERLIEDQKDKMLESSRLPNVKPGILGSMVRYGLRPLTDMIPIEELFSQIGFEYDNSKTPDENFKIISETNGVIVLTRSTKSPIDFDIRGLIDVDYIIKEDLKQAPIIGLNPKVIRRYETLKVLSEPTPESPLKVYPGKTTSWYVFETAADSKYRLLVKENTNIALKHGGTEMPKSAHMLSTLSRRKVEGLRSPLVSENEVIGLLKGLSLRAERYNHIQETEILSKCFDPLSKHILTTYTDTPHIIDINQFAIQEKLMSKINEEIATSKPKHAADFKRIILDQNTISTIITDVILQKQQHQRGSVEYLVTYVTRIDNMISSFMREAERQFRQESIPGRLFKEHTDSQIISILQDTFKNILKRTIEELNRNKSWSEYELSLKEYTLNKKQIII